MSKILKEAFNSHLERELPKKDLVDQYGAIIHLLGSVIGKYILGVLGFICDYFVLFSIFFLSIRSFYGAVIIAGALAIVVQAAYGGLFFRAGITYFRGQYINSGHRAMMIISGLVAVVFLGASFWLNNQSDKIVDAFAELSFEDVDIYDRKDEFAAREEEILQQYNKDKKALEDRAATLLQDKIMYLGVNTVRERSTREANRISKIDIPELTKSKDNSLAALRDEKAQYEAEKRQQRSEAKAKQAEDIRTGKLAVIGFNFFINLARVLLMLMYAFFIAKVEQERGQTTPQKRGSNEKQKRGSTIGYRQYRPQVDTEAETVQNRVIHSEAGEPQRQEPQGRTIFFNRSSETGQVHGSTTGQSVVIDGQEYSVKMMEGVPAMPYVKSDGEVVYMTLKQAQAKKNEYQRRMRKRKDEGKAPTPNQVQKHKMWKEYESALKSIKNG